ncbi:MAG: DUF3037 domain-containing protein [Chitinophagaceae bacterium]|nr:DUF3037 domain-containing protein [Chitinophagaceae bacterium]
MQENHLFEYAVIRVVPRVEREEFLNVGVILHCRDQHFLQSICTPDEQKIRSLCSSIDIEALKTYLQSFDKICKGGRDAGPIGELDRTSRFRWLTAMRSGIIQISGVHIGLCKNAGETLARLHKELVL